MRDVTGDGDAGCAAGGDCASASQPDVLDGDLTAIREGQRAVDVVTARAARGAGDEGGLAVKVPHGDAEAAGEREQGFGTAVAGGGDQPGSPASPADPDVAGVGDDQRAGHREVSDRKADFSIERSRLPVADGGVLEVGKDRLLPARPWLHDEGARAERLRRHQIRERQERQAAVGRGSGRPEAPERSRRRELNQPKLGVMMANAGGRLGNRVRRCVHRPFHVTLLDAGRRARGDQPVVACLVRAGRELHLHPAFQQDRGTGGDRDALATAGTPLVPAPQLGMQGHVDRRYRGPDGDRDRVTVGGRDSYLVQRAVAEG